MQPREKTPLKNDATLAIKGGAILLLFFFSILVVACGADANTTAVNTNGPVVTVTIHLGNNNQTPTPPVANYNCGAWITDTSPRAGVSAVVVNSKFTHNVAGNPEGVPNASAVAIVNWADHSPSTAFTSQTTADGLATFTIPLPPNPNQGLLNHETLITVEFSSGGNKCSVGIDRPAFFVLLPPTITPTATPNANAPTPDPNKKN